MRGNSMEKNVKISLLCEIYGKLLTEKQYTLLNDYYNNDLSLSEIAENESITRQAVMRIIQKSKNKIKEYEQKLQIMKKQEEIKKNIEILKKDIKSNKNLDKIENLLSI